MKLLDALQLLAYFCTVWAEHPGLNSADYKGKSLSMREHVYVQRELQDRDNVL